jgi:tRNA U34 5-carboxymethylaminomethyl modifying enzyme MnmG/GidA
MDTTNTDTIATTNANIINTDTTNTINTDININTTPNKQNNRRLKANMLKDNGSNENTLKLETKKIQKNNNNINIVKSSDISMHTIYNIITDTNNILSTLVKNITTDDTFHKYISVLQESDIPTEQKKSRMIQDTINNIRIFNTNINPLF